MKFVFFLVLWMSLTACTQENVEEFVFRKTVEYDLIELCEDDSECKEAVKSQIKPCMESSNWREFVDNQDDDLAIEKFAKAFYRCFVDTEGNPYF